MTNKINQYKEIAIKQNELIRFALLNSIKTHLECESMETGGNIIDFRQNLMGKKWPSLANIKHVMLCGKHEILKCYEYYEYEPFEDSAYDGKEFEDDVIKVIKKYANKKPRED